MPEIIELPALTLVGLEGRTSNANEATESGIVVKTIAKFYSKQLFATVPDQVKAEHNYAVLSNYESDQNGEYDYMMAVMVNSVPEALPAGVTVKEIPAGKYAVFVSERGPMPNVIIELWGKIWSMSEEEMGGKPNFIANFEEYSPESGTPDDMQVKIYISID